MAVMTTATVVIGTLTSRSSAAFAVAAPSPPPPHRRRKVVVGRAGERSMEETYGVRVERGASHSHKVRNLSVDLSSCYLIFYYFGTKDSHIRPKNSKWLQENLSGGIQLAIAQLPLLQLIDCGMSVCVVNSQSGEDKSHTSEGNGEVKCCQKLSTMRPQPMYQKLIIKHAHLKKLSLWGCSGLDVPLHSVLCQKFIPVTGIFKKEKGLVKICNLEQIH